ncbi:MAG: hypothetical protein IPH44_10925 [Myxococcales bacterium]|nr:hypothetical protein [Myxococcales bacterium]
MTVGPPPSPPPAGSSTPAPARPRIREAPRRAGQRDAIADRDPAPEVGADRHLADVLAGALDDHRAQRERVAQRLPGDRIGDDDLAHQLELGASADAVPGAEIDVRVIAGHAEHHRVGHGAGAADGEHQAGDEEGGAHGHLAAGSGCGGWAAHGQKS